MKSISFFTLFLCIATAVTCSPNEPEPLTNLSPTPGADPSPTPKPLTAQNKEDASLALSFVIMRHTMDIQATSSDGDSSRRASRAFAVATPTPAPTSSPSPTPIEVPCTSSLESNCQPGTDILFNEDKTQAGSCDETCSGSGSDFVRALDCELNDDQVLRYDCSEDKVIELTEFSSTIEQRPGRCYLGGGALLTITLPHDMKNLSGRITYGSLENVQFKCSGDFTIRLAFTVSEGEGSAAGFTDSNVKCTINGEEVTPAPSPEVLCVSLEPSPEPSPEPAG